MAVATARQASTVVPFEFRGIGRRMSVGLGPRMTARQWNILKEIL
jgi:hypothetical protein